jgi:hypothetical protein
MKNGSSDDIVKNKMNIDMNNKENINAPHIIHTNIDNDKNGIVNPTDFNTNKINGFQDEYDDDETDIGEEEESNDDDDDTKQNTGNYGNTNKNDSSLLVDTMERSKEKSTVDITVARTLKMLHDDDGDDIEEYNTVIPEIKFSKLNIKKKIVYNDNRATSKNIEITHTNTSKNANKYVERKMKRNRTGVYIRNYKYDDDDEDDDDDDDEDDKDYSTDESDVSTNDLVKLKEKESKSLRKLNIENVIGLFIEDIRNVDCLVGDHDDWFNIKDTNERVFNVITMTMLEYGVDMSMEFNDNEQLKSTILKLYTDLKNKDVDSVSDYDWFTGDFMLVKLVSLMYKKLLESIDLMLLKKTLFLTAVLESRLQVTRLTRKRFWLQHTTLNSKTYDRIARYFNLTILLRYPSIFNYQNNTKKFWILVLRSSEVRKYIEECLNK